MDDHFILEIDNFIPESICNEIIKRFESDPNKEQSRIGVKADNSGGCMDLARRNSREITPRTTDQLRREIGEIYPDYIDHPIQTEEYSQWVIENKFASEFPDLTKVGVTITDKLDPYEETNIRILNGGHTSLAYLGVLSGYTTFDQEHNCVVHLF